MEGVAPDQTAERQLPRRFGKYTLIRKLAVGGMAEIFLALQKSMAGFEKLVVVKRILPKLAQDTEFVEMLLAEARIAATLNHPNVAHIYDVGVWNGEYYIAMEHINGEDLRGIVRQMKVRDFRSFPLEHSLAIVLGCCKGLQFAHSKKSLDGEPMEIVHRDVSPQNILVTFSGDVKLVDFGIAKAGRSSAEDTKDGKLKGKVPYMSPEQARGIDLDSRSDVFSIGIILFELCTGRRLFRGKSELETLKKIVSGGYPLPTSYNPHIPEGLEEIIMRALEVDADKRYSSAREMQAELEALVRRDQLAVSPISLGAWMRSLFADKLHEQTRLLQEGRMLASQLPEPEPFEDIGSMGSIGSRSGVRNRDEAAPQGMSTKAKLGAAIAAICLAAGAAAVAWPSGGGEAALQVNTVPQGAELRINGQARGGTTPATVEGLAVGETYNVTLRLDGYEEVTIEHLLSEEAGSRQLTTDLVALPEAAVGALRLRSQPRGARVIWNGRDTGQVTPTTLTDLPAGEAQSVALVLDGYETISAQVVVAANGLDEESYELSPTPLGPGESRLVLEVTPSAATLRVGDDAYEGGGPYVVRMPAGRHRVVVSHTGFRTFERTLTLPDAEELRHRVSLVAQVTRPSDGERPTPSGAPGSIRVGSSPWCNVSIDGRAIGQTPIAGFAASPGPHTVTCVNPEQGLRARRRVQVISGQSARVRFNLR